MQNAAFFWAVKKTKTVVVKDRKGLGAENRLNC
jgi:hypothetical protein